MRYNDIETDNNDVKIGNNGLIELECCPDQMEARTSFDQKYAGRG